MNSAIKYKSTSEVAWDIQLLHLDVTIDVQDGGRLGMVNDLDEGVKAGRSCRSHTGFDCVNRMAGG
jgi:hypothetical protein